VFTARMAGVGTFSKASAKGDGSTAERADPQPSWLHAGMLPHSFPAGTDTHLTGYCLFTAQATAVDLSATADGDRQLHDC
jgi:hypothetical protein